MENPKQGANDSNVIPLRAPPARRREPPLTDAELREWRRLVPQLRRMARQMEILTTECPVARQLVAPE